MVCLRTPLGALDVHAWVSRPRRAIDPVARAGLPRIVEVLVTYSRKVGEAHLLRVVSECLDNLGYPRHRIGYQPGLQLPARPARTITLMLLKPPPARRNDNGQISCDSRPHATLDDRTARDPLTLPSPVRRLPVLALRPDAVAGVEFATTLSLAGIDPVGGMVTGVAEARHLTERFEQHRPHSVQPPKAFVEASPGWRQNGRRATVLGSLGSSLAWPSWRPQRT